MPRVAVNKGHIRDVSDYASWLKDNNILGCVAAYKKLDIGRRVWIIWQDGTMDGPYLIIDTVAESEYNLGILRGRVIDVDYATAEKHDALLGPVPVTVVYDWDTIIEFGFLPI